MLSLSGFIISHSSTDSQPSLKTNQPIFSNTFDLGSGGASITRTTQEGAFFSNPSLPAFGPDFLRWIFVKTSFEVGEKALTSGSEISQNAEDPQKLLEQIFGTPIHLGAGTAVGTLTSNFGFATFASTQIDIEARQYGTDGLPEIRLRNHGYGGIATTLSYELGDKLALGLGPKYIYAAEMNTDILATDLLENQLENKAKDAFIKGFGVGMDAAATLQLRSSFLDFRIAGVAENVGGVTFVGNVAPWKQTFNGGASVTLHSDESALHCAADLRDITEEYEEHWTKRAYAGCKMLFTKWIGFGTGLYQGYPTFGFVLDLYVLRLEAASYTKEYGSQLNISPRKSYVLSIAIQI